MHIVRHRRNTIDQLKATDISFGVEVDVRSIGSDLIIHHDPFVAGELFVEWIEYFQHQMLILNVKEEGLEERLLEIMRSKKIENFFFLDQSFPFIVRTAQQGERRCAVRVSEYESIETALSIAHLVDWVWVDCFTRFPLSRKDADRLHEAELKLCLVSPELLGRSQAKEITDLQQLLHQSGIEIDAVCTKKPELWM